MSDLYSGIDPYTPTGTGYTPAGTGYTPTGTGYTPTGSGAAATDGPVGGGWIGVLPDPLIIGGG